MIRLSTRLSLWYAGTFILLLGGGFTLAWIVIAHRLDAAVDADLLEDVAELRAVYRLGGANALQEWIDDEMSREDAEAEFLRLVRTGPAPTPTMQQEPGMPWYRQLSPPDLPHDSDTVLSTRSHDAASNGEPVPFREITALVSADLLIHAGESLHAREETLSLLARIFTTMLLLGLPLSGLAGWLMARRAARDIEQIGVIATRIGRSGFEERVRLQPVDREIDLLVRTFNGMLDRIRDLMKEMRELTDSIAHDLKSPLARIRFMSEVALSRNLAPGDQAQQAEQTIEECDRLIRMIDATLDVAEAESGMRRGRWQVTDYSALVRDAVELFEPVAAGKGLGLACRVAQGLRVDADRTNLQRLVANLVDNAIKYTPAPGNVEVRLDAGDDQAVLTVTDTGIGIAESEQSAVFSRFYRCDHSRNRDGCGLGLSFARAVARQMGGDIQVQSAPGVGSRFRVILPLSDAPIASAASGSDAREDKASQPASAMESR